MSPALAMILAGIGSAIVSAVLVNAVYLALVLWLERREGTQK